MSRIRSIHPGLWTDDSFMSLSAFARLLYIGLLNEAWDDGVFEWKPLTIKARIFPVDSVDVPALLDELVEVLVQVQEPTDGIRHNIHAHSPPTVSPRQDARGAPRGCAEGVIVDHARGGDPACSRQLTTTAVP